jgi:hypothetical protein
VRARNVDETIDKTSAREFHRRARSSRDETVSRRAERPPDRSAVEIRRIRARARSIDRSRARALTRSGETKKRAHASVDAMRRDVERARACVPMMHS